MEETTSNEAEIKKPITCSFCDKDRNQVEQMVEGPEFGDRYLYICNECVDMSHELLHKEPDVKKLKKKKHRLPTPEEIKKYLDEYIVGQDSAKIALSVAFYNHHKRISKEHTSVEIEKSNLLMVGPSGSGKTLAVKTIAKLFDLPYIVIDATTLTEAGYVGEDAENLIKRLLQAADNDVEKAQKGIIFIDEIDKKSRRSESSSFSRDISGEGVQQSLLKLMEGTTVKIDDDDVPVEFDTKNVLFIFSGSFVGLDEVIRKNASKSTIGIGANLIQQKNVFSETVKAVKTEDFIKYGLIPEFVGRCPIVVVFDDLNREIVYRILKEPKNNIVDQFKELFKYEGISLEFDDKYLYNVADECLKQSVGARGLRSIIERDLQETQYLLPSLSKKGLAKVVVDSASNIKHTYKIKKRANNEQQN